MKKLAYFDEYSSLFNKHGFRLYIIGGTSRDLLLGREIRDYDFTTDATPEQISEFLPGGSLRYSKFGCYKIKRDDFEIDFTTLRIEKNYKDFRHPNKITFTSDPLFDYVRRDFTMNAIYIDEEYRLIDYCGGYVDLKEGIIRFIGDPYQRIKEDPLRILRAERFKKELNFTFDPLTERALVALRPLVDKLNVDKIKLEAKKHENL